MRINIICIGKLKEKYLVDAQAEYIKRLSRFCDVNILELNDEKDDVPDAMEKEGTRILSKIDPKDYVICLAIEGKKLNSDTFSEKITSVFDSSKPVIDFVIGGSLGLSDSVKKRADMLLSFSDMTFPHQLMRIILLEQVYRSFKIANNESYHK
ncbi:MAG: Ribosomal RNA large subunit methyltransferase H [Firmicutes bacterium ADurb.Bin146]|jgi:23S rRNA (pseudouridine1915-N3)-methyltransferase|nr:MAG: Ribosomal RNA large subunit methyltransferase H [Firmicutes bacterium ADurb.Bin146]